MAPEWIEREREEKACLALKCLGGSLFSFRESECGLRKKDKKENGNCCCFFPSALSYDGEEKGALMANYIRDDSLSLSHLILLRKLAQDFAEKK